jgi:ketosteroid isomerase-like protein
MSQENVEIVRRWWKGFNEDGMPPLALCDDNSRSAIPRTSRSAGCSRDTTRVRRWRDQVFDIIENPRVETEDIIDAHGDGETVLMLLRATGKAAYTGLDIEVEWAAVWTIRNGKLLRAQGYLSRADAVEAAGLSE